MIAITFFLTLSPCLVMGDLYVDPVTPYNHGDLPVTERVLSPVMNPLSPMPMHTRVYYPDTEGLPANTTFGVYYFVTGFGSYLPPMLYADHLRRVAAHGYVAISAWSVLTDDGLSLNFTARAHLSNIEYLKENLPLKIRDVADFERLGLGCHSAGCGPTFHMLRMEPSKYKASLFYEPVSVSIHMGVSFHVPSVMLGAELANNSCSVPGFDFETFYYGWTCPRLMLEVADVGHGGFMDHEFWEICRDTQQCNVEDESMLPAYRTLVEGVTSAMLNTYIQGSHDHLRYVTDPDLIPMALVQHEADMEC